MCPRPYRSTRRQESTEATRARIVEAARRLLTVSTGAGGFSVDLVAREADVARATVYYQFGSKRALYDAVADDLAVRADLGARLGAAFALAAAPDVLDAVVAAFTRFWAGDAAIIRRLHALGALDPDIGRADAERNDRRRQALRAVLQRLGAEGIEPAGDPAEVLETIQVLTGFEVYDQLAASSMGPERAAETVRRLVRSVLGLPG